MEINFWIGSSLNLIANLPDIDPTDVTAHQKSMDLVVIRDG